MPTRRSILMTGGAAVLIFGAGYAGHVLTRNIDRARAPWRAAAEGFGDPRLDALAYAILAPNPHNRQPWLIELMGENEFMLYADQSKLLPHTDPPNRQITIGFGAFIELFRQAAAENGYRATIMPFPDGEPQPHLDGRPIAFVRMTPDPGIERDPLFEVALTRRTTREQYRADPVSDELMSQMAALAFPAGPSNQAFRWTSDADEVTYLKDLSSRAWQIELETEATWRESVDVTRIGAQEINENPDGISLDGAFMEVMEDTGVLSREAMLTPGSLPHSMSLDYYNQLIDATATFGVLSSRTNMRLDQLVSGQSWVRLNQAATALGIDMHPISQALQEFPEMAGPYNEIHEHFGVALPARIQGFMRFGYGPDVPPAPRWPLESRLISA